MGVVDWLMFVAVQYSQAGVGVACAQDGLALDRHCSSAENGLLSHVGHLAVDTADAVTAFVAATTSVLHFRFALWNILLLLVSTIALGMMGLVLSSGPAVFALLDWTAFGGDQFEISVMVITVAHAVTPDAGVARPLLSVPKHDCWWWTGRRRQPM
jgi:hypothetical protein